MLKWTKRQRKKLNAILTPHKNDPPFPSAAESWAATGISGDAPTTLGSSSISRPDDALVDFWVSTFGLIAACEFLRSLTEECDHGIFVEWFEPMRRHLYTCDESEFEKARHVLFHDLETTSISMAVTLSRDPSVAKVVLNNIGEMSPSGFTHLLIALSAEDGLAALNDFEKSFSSFEHVFDLVEALGADAAPILNGVLNRWNGKASYRKPIEQALKLGLSGGAVEPKKVEPKATEPQKGWSMEAPPVEGYYNFDKTVVVSGRFDLNKETILLRLTARGIRCQSGFGSKNHFTMGFFSGEKAKVKLIEDSSKRNISVLGEKELSVLLKTPLFRYRERFEEIVKHQLASPGYRVRSWWIGAPATEDEIQAAEKEFGVPLEPALRSFYQQCNGIQLETQDVKVNKTFINQNIAPKRMEYGGEGECRFVVDIPPLDLLCKQDHDIGAAAARPNVKLKIGKKRISEEEFSKNSYLFDQWDYYYPILLVLDPKNGNARVIFGDDHGATYETGDETSVEVYLESAISDSFSSRCIGKILLSRRGPDMT